MGEEFGWRQWTHTHTGEKGKERKRLACFQWCRSLRSNCAYRSVLLSRQRSQCPLPLRLFGRGRVVRRGSARCTQCLRASRSTSLYPAARCSRGPYIIITNRRLISNRVANSRATLVLHKLNSRRTFSRTAICDFPRLLSHWW